VLCNAGGVIVSYFEWLQNKRSEFWELEEVDAQTASQNGRRVPAGCAIPPRSSGTDWRTAAYIVALSRLEKVYKERGIFP
jgi:glutamate dehydrogenase (NAD(P)+)